MQSYEKVESKTKDFNLFFAETEKIDLLKEAGEYDLNLILAGRAEFQHQFPNLLRIVVVVIGRDGQL